MNPARLARELFDLAKHAASAAKGMHARGDANGGYYNDGREAMAELAGAPASEPGLAPHGEAEGGGEAVSDDLPEILNCPCCDGPPQYAAGINGLRIHVYVYCCHCSMRTEIVGSHEAAAAVWNKRPAAERAAVVAHLRTGGRTANEYADAIEAGDHHEVKP